MIATADQDVLRLDVAVDQARLVRGVERLGDRVQDPQRAPGVELARDDHVLQVRPADDAHGQEQAVIRLAGLVDRDDVRVVDRGLQQALAAEALAERVIVAEIDGEELERDRSVQRELGRLVDDAHPSLSEDALDAVARESGALF